MSMSLDGYVADRADGVAEVFDGDLDSGDVEFHAGGSDAMTFGCPNRAPSIIASGPSSVRCSPVGAPVTVRRGRME